MDMHNLWPEVERLLPQVERPSRYIGSEWGQPPLHQDDFGFCMIYPDTYELGQPNQAVRILVNRINAEPGLRAERAYLPAVDMIELMRRDGVPLFSLESMCAVSAFDVVGITLPHELAATNILEILDLAGIPVRASERREDDPVVIAGGPCAFNPEPYHLFFDAFLIGEGEESVPEVVRSIQELRAAGVAREEIMRELSHIPGTYVPSLYVSSLEANQELPASDALPVEPLFDDVPRVVLKRVYDDFACSPAFEPVLVPYTEAVHDRLNVEVLRGCARGCRFCQAGMIYRPVRERSVDNIVDAVRSGLAASGYEEVSLTSLSTTDHSGIENILTALNDDLSHTGVRVSLPSQRLDSFGVEMACLVAGNKRGGLTFAPEAGSQRLRDAINKNVTEDDLMGALRAALEAGWRRCKLYFMIGLPTETDEDVAAIGQLAQRAFDLMREMTAPADRGALSLTVSVALFVPKAQTPFQWDGQIGPDEAYRRVDIIRSNVRSRAIRVTYHEPRTSLIEAVMSRGGREVAFLVEEAWKRGARFDAWTELFNEEAWNEAARALGIDMSAIAQQSFEPGSMMPFDHIASGVSKAFLTEERKRCNTHETTHDCTFASCTRCGVCPETGCSNALETSRGSAHGYDERSSDTSLANASAATGAHAIASGEEVSAHHG